MNIETKKALRSNISVLDVDLKKLRVEKANNETNVNNLLRTKKSLVEKIEGLEKKKKEILEDLQKEEKVNA